MAETADVFDITKERLRRNAVLSVRPATRKQQLPNWLDLTSSNIMRMFLAELPRGPRLVNESEIYFTTTALNGAGHYMASEQFLSWNPLMSEKPAPPRPRPNLTITVFDRDRERTATRGALQAL